MEKNDAKNKRTALGRGLSTLISSPVPVSFKSKWAAELSRGGQGEPTAAAVTSVESNAVLSMDIAPTAIGEAQAEIRYVDLQLVSPNPTQPRQTFKEEELEELSNSIRVLGVLQPILVRSVKGTSLRYEIIAGERRWRAAQRAGLLQIPVVVRNFDDRETLEVALVENVQRSNLNPVEEAQAYHRLSEEFSLTQQEIAERVGKDRVTVANCMRLLKLAPEILGHLKDGALGMGHARAILAIKEPSAQISLARKAIQEKLTVRELETLVSRAVVLDGGRAVAAGKSTSRLREGATQGAFPEIVERLRNALGTKISVRHQRSGKGKIEIEYFSEAELDRVVEKICGV